MKHTIETPAADGLTCDEALAALALGGATLSDSLAAHLSACGQCQAERARAEAVGRALSRYPVAAPAPDARARTLAAAASLLARRAAAARGLRRRIAWALALTLVPLPAILYANVKLLLAAHGLLVTLVPASVALYLTLSIGSGVALLLALSYTAVPLLAARRPWLFSLEDRDVHVRVAT